MTERVIQEKQVTRDCDLCGGPMDAARRHLILTASQAGRLGTSAATEHNFLPVLRIIVERSSRSSGREGAVRDVCARCLGPMLRKLERVICYGETAP